MEGKSESNKREIGFQSRSTEQRVVRRVLEVLPATPQKKDKSSAEDHNPKFKKKIGKDGSFTGLVYCRIQMDPALTSSGNLPF